MSRDVGQCFLDDAENVSSEVFRKVGQDVEIQATESVFSAVEIMNQCLKAGRKTDLVQNDGAQCVRYVPDLTYDRSVN